MKQLELPFVQQKLGSRHGLKYCGTVLSVPEGSQLAFINTHHHPYFIEFGDPRWGAEHLFKIHKDFKGRKGSLFCVNNMMFEIVFEEHCDDFERVALWAKEYKGN